MSEHSKEQTFALLKDSLDEAQISVRAYDTKAQFVGVGYIFALNVIGDIGRMANDPGSGDIVTIVIAWLLVILPIALFGYVLYPMRKSAKEQTSDGRSHIFYLHPDRHGSSEALIAAAESCDPVDEIAHELLQISILRESKRKRFVTALASAGVTFSVLFASQLLASAGTL
ncbi:hypothetical protein EH31_10385 [Erythrobacter longus]|uniref:Pycsar effector protein domain-containing protein n=1 Tax=Erythrobacter longus TaxID=1044 RepID=A0A074M6U4_ERYLO|nr:hypothetical protein [Erythrobacter longus]KEO90486.1 hypothetical protein EH31_10385 [Erythrobacter longus]